MTAVQLDYPDSIGTAYPGMPYGLLPRDAGHSYSVETGTLRYGSAACLATNSGNPDIECIQPDANNLKFRGVVIREQIREVKLTALAGQNGTGELHYLEEGDVASIGKKGAYYVTVSGAVVAGDAAFFIHAGTGTEMNGDFAASALAGRATAITNMRATFTTSAADGEIAVLELD